jgi:predicted MFS family arabinose efflux permease
MQLDRSQTRLLALLVLVGTSNYLDRYILSIALPAIRTEYKVDDVVLGLLSGPAFAFVYAAFGLPWGMLADRLGRKAVVASSLALFSFAVLLSGFVTNLWQLGIARLVTGLGEAGTTPACTALIASAVPQKWRASALSIFASSGNIGLVLAFFLGGAIVQYWGWRSAFIASAVLGFVALAAVLLFIREPDRESDAALPAPTRAAIASLWSQPAFRWVVAGSAIASIRGYAAVAFVPSFFVRSHHMSPAAIGISLAILSGTAGWAGTVLPGVLADRWKPHDPGFGLRFSSLGIGFSVPFLPIFYLAPQWAVVMASAVPLVFFSAVFLGPAYAAVQRIASEPMWAQASAVLFLTLNLIGLGLGPQLAGLVSTALQPSLGTDALRYALLIIEVTSLLPSAFCFWRASRLLATVPAQAAC